MPPPRPRSVVNVAQAMTATDVRSRVGGTARRAAWIGLPWWWCSARSAPGSTLVATATDRQTRRPAGASSRRLRPSFSGSSASPRPATHPRRTVVRSTPCGRPARSLLARHRGLDRPCAHRHGGASPRADRGARRLRHQRGRRLRASCRAAHGDDRRPGGRRDRPGGGTGIASGCRSSASRSCGSRMAGSASLPLPTGAVRCGPTG